MKNIKTALLIITLVCCATTSFAQSALQSKIQLKTPYSVSEEASQNSMSNSSELNNPFINSYLGAMGNMINSDSNNAYNTQEMQKQNLDYTRQQANRTAK